jgi:hypothetical protein
VGLWVWGGIIRAFSNGILLTARTWEDEEILDVCRFYVDTVNSNIAEFLKARPSISVSLENVGQDFEKFLSRIDARGDLESAYKEWNSRHNASME